MMGLRKILGSLVWVESGLDTWTWEFFFEKISVDLTKKKEDGIEGVGCGLKVAWKWLGHLDVGVFFEKISVDLTKKKEDGIEEKILGSLVWVGRWLEVVGHLDVGVPLNREPQTRADTSGQAAKQINVRILEKSAEK